MLHVENVAMQFALLAEVAIQIGHVLAVVVMVG